MLLERLGDLQRLRAELGLGYAFVSAASAGVGVRRLVGQVFAGQHAARNWAVGRHAHAVVLARRQHLHLGHAVEQVVVRLADHRAWHAQLAGQAHHLSNAPTPKIGDAPVANLARLQHGLQRTQRLLQVHAVVVQVQVQNIDVVGLQPRQRGRNVTQHPAARVVALVDPLRHLVAQLGGQHPVMALALEQRTHHGLRGAFGVNVCGIDVIDAVGMGIGHDGLRLGLRRLVAKHHGAQAQGGHLQIAVP